MSANDIIAALPALSRNELEKVEGRLQELLEVPKMATVWEGLLEIAGTAHGLPPDLAKQHDHYVHGTQKR